MILSSVKIIFIIYVVMNILEIRNIHVYNLNSNLIMVDNVNRQKIQYEIENLSPLLLSSFYNEDFSNENLIKKNPGYMIKELDKYILLKELKDNFTIYDNDKIVTDLDLDTEKIFNLFDNKLTTNKKACLSLYGSNIQSVMLKCCHNMTAYTSSSDFVFYLFNPKHINDITGKELQKIKKWAIKTNLLKGDVLYIPCEWNYIYEGRGNLLKLTFDNYFSVGYNFIRE